MTNEEKFILLQELSSRLPYGVKVFAGEDLAMTLRQVDYQCFCECWENEEFKSNSRWMLPYLRPLSSMTEEEKEEYKKVIETLKWTEEFDFYNKYHFDYRGLIPMGLALEAKKGMYIIK